MAGVPRNLSWLWPVIVDGTILQATISVIALAQFDDQRSGRRFFWWVLVIAALVSIGANAMHAFISQTGSLHPMLSAAIATVAPVSLLAATHGLGILVRIPASQLPSAQLSSVQLSSAQLPSSGPVPVPPAPVPEAAVNMGAAVNMDTAGATDLEKMAASFDDPEPLDSVDRWILDEDRVEDLYPVDAP